MKSREDRPARVEFKPRPLHDMLRWTLYGIARRHKQERLGFIFGRVRRNRLVVIERATLYRGGKRTRSGASTNALQLLVRRYWVGRRLHRRPLGTFHSHISSRGEPAHGVSPQDRRAFRLDAFGVVAVIVAVRPACREPNRTSKRTLIGYDAELGCTFNVRAYSITGLRPKLLPVRIVG